MKKLIALLLALTLVFAFVSCSDDSSDSVNDGGSENENGTTDPSYPRDEIFTDENGDQNLPIIPVN